MPTPQELQKKFWKALKSDRTVMLGLIGPERGHVRPMTAQAEDESGPVWFFTAKDSALVQNLTVDDRALCSFVSKDHDIFASVQGKLQLDNDRAVIDRLWNPFIAAWYEGGKDDPKLALLRFDPEDGEIWLDGSSLIAGIKILFGADPKEDYKDNVAKVNFR